MFPLKFSSSGAVYLFMHSPAYCLTVPNLISSYLSIGKFIRFNTAFSESKTVLFTHSSHLINIGLKKESILNIRFLIRIRGVI